MTEEPEGKPPEAGPDEGKPVEGAAPQGVTYDGPIEKFKGKTADEIAQSYAEVEKMASERDRALKEAQDKVSGYEQWYRQQQMQQMQQQPQPQNPQYQQPVAPQAPPDIYDNPAAFVSQTVQPVIDQRLEKMEFQHSLESANQAKYLAKQMYPDAFDGVDESKLDNIMFGGVNSGGINHRALRDPKGWVMAAGQMKLAEMDYKFTPTSPQPMSPTQTEAPAGKQSEGESVHPSESQREAQRLFGDVLSKEEMQNLLKETINDPGGEE